MTVSSPPLAEAGLLDAALGALLRLGDGTADRTAAERDRAEATELRALRTAHPGRRVRFLHQREVADGSVARALLLTCEDRGTISLSWTPPSTVPWVLRGARRSSESVLLSVDGVPMTVEDAMAHLDVLWGQTALLDRLVNAAVVQRVLSERPVSLSAAQLQSAVDAVRRSRGLLTAEATRRWLDERGLTHGGLERLARWEAELADLRDRVTAAQVPGWLAEHPGAGVRVRCTTVTVADPAAATRLAGAAATGSLAHAAATALLDGALLEVAAVEAVADELPGRPAGEAGHTWSVPVGDRTLVGQVVEVLDRSAEAAHRRAQDVLFTEWLADQRRAARIRWGWGETARTQEVTAGAGPS